MEWSVKSKYWTFLFRKGFASKLKKNLGKIQVKQAKNAPSKINLNWVCRKLCISDLIPTIEVRLSKSSRSLQTFRLSLNYKTLTLRNKVLFGGPTKLVFKIVIIKLCSSAVQPPNCLRMSSNIYLWADLEFESRTRSGISGK